MPSASGSSDKLLVEACHARQVLACLHGLHLLQCAGQHHDLHPWLQTCMFSIKQSESGCTVSAEGRRAAERFAGDATSASLQTLLL